MGETAVVEHSSAIELHRDMDSSTRDDAAWPRLCLLAVERGLTRASLRLAERRSEAATTGSAVDAWLDAQIAVGLLREVSPTSCGPSGLGHGPRYRLDPATEQQITRRLARDAQLDRVVEQAQRLFGERSLAPLDRAIQRGDLADFDRQLARRAKVATASGAEWLRTSLCAAFDPRWLERTFGDQAEVAVARVLSEALAEPAPCEPLYRWALAEELPRTVPALCEQAILRGDGELAVRLSAKLPPREALFHRAAASFQRGDLPGARAALEAAFPARRPKASARCGAVAPIIAILLLEQEMPRARAAARRLVKDAGEPRMARAFRRLLRHLEGSGDDPRRLDVYQLPADAAGWEIVIGALTVHLHVDREATRGGWAMHLVRRAKTWSGSGYGWLAKQAWLLAQELHPHHCRAEMSRLGLAREALTTEARELRLWDRLAPKPEWKRALEALDGVSTAIAQLAESAYRVVWFIDMAAVRLGRPLLERYDVEDGGWAAGRRVSIDEIRAVEDRLPPEDRDVLRRLDTRLRNRDDADLFEALIGHPRVVSGARGMTPVEVSRGHCRVETRDVAGGIAVAVEPGGASLGLNVVVDDPSRVTVYRVDPALDRVIRALPQGVRIPKEREPELLAVLAKLSSGVAIVGPHLGAERSVAADATPCIRIAAQAGAFVAQVGVRPFGEKGRFFAAAGGPPSVRAMIEGRRLRCERDFEEERARSAELLAACPRLVPSSDEDLVSFGEVGVLELLSELQQLKVDHALEWRGTSGLFLSGSVTRKHLRGRLRCIKGWYLADGAVRLDAATEVTLAEIARAPTLADGRFLRIAPGEYAEVESHLIRALAALRTAASARGPSLRIHPAAIPALREIAACGDAFEVDAETRAWLSRVERVQSTRFRVPSALKAELRPYQREGYQWLRRLGELGIGACLADDMGLGKTVQIIAVLAVFAKNGPCLVVAPTSVCSNWARELARFAPSLEVVDYAGPDRARALDGCTGGIFITSYALLQQDAAALTQISWEVVVLDEAQFIKNPESLRARAAYDLVAKRRIAATGTPVENDVGDLWAIFRFLEPGLLGSWRSFRRTYLRPIERDGDGDCLTLLRATISGYVLRRLKKDVLSALPPLTEVVHDVELGEAEAALYAALQREVRERLFSPSGRGNKLEVLAEITRLRRFACHPRLVYPDAEIESSKIEALLPLVEELRESGHRALVFSQWVGFLDLVREQLEERGVSYEYLDGSTPRGERQARVDAFQEGSATLFVISLKAGGFGLNLTGADYVIHLDPWWNPAVEAQATDRSHRIGQDRPVTVYRLVTKGTIEEKIVALQGKKRELARALLPGTHDTALTADDLTALLDPDRTV